MYSIAMSSNGGTNPQSGSATSWSSDGKHRTGSHGSATSNSSSSSSRLPPLFYLMEMGDWRRATVRAQNHPREVKGWASLRTKYIAPHKISSAKRLALHHACFKLRTTVNARACQNGLMEDPFIEVCRFILALLEIYPEAASMRESRHGCLPLHLAAFASCTKPSTSIVDSFAESDSLASPSSTSSMSSTPTNLLSPATAVTGNTTVSSPASASLARPSRVTNAHRSVSESTADTIHTNMTNMMEQEYYTGAQTFNFQQQQHHDPQSRFQRRASGSSAEFSATTTPRNNTVSVSMGNNLLVSEKRETMAVRVLNALLDAYPRGIRMDSEGGRLPLHMACAGRATPRVISTLVTAYTAAARHRNKDGFLPLHVAAHWGISHPNVATNLLKAYPDATFGRNRWERTPLEEALCMAGENGRPHQSALVRSLRKHPSYWTRPSDVFEKKSPRECRRIVDTDETIPSIDDESSVEDDVPQFYNPDGELFKDRISLFARKGTEVEEEGVEPLSHLVVDLPTLIRNQNWAAVIRALECNPHDADEELRTTTRGGFVSSSGYFPLHYAAERRPPPEVVDALIQASPGAILTRAMPGGCLPLHIACTWYSSPAAIIAMLLNDRSACRVQDELGNTPLHCACFSGATLPALEALIRAHPKSVLSRNHQGSLPEDICNRLRHSNRREALQLLTTCKDELLARQKKKASSGNLLEVAMQALELDERVRVNPTAAPQSGEHAEAQDGFEVAYERNDGEDLVWV